MRRQYYNPQVIGKLKHREGWSLGSELRAAPSQCPWSLPCRGPTSPCLAHTASPKVNSAWTSRGCSESQGHLCGLEEQSWPGQFTKGASSLAHTAKTCQTLHTAAPFSPLTLLAVQLGALVREDQTDCTWGAPDQPQDCLYHAGWGLPRQTQGGLISSPVLVRASRKPWS